MLSIRLGDNSIGTGVFTADFSCYASDNKTRSHEKVAIKLEPNQLRVWMCVYVSMYRYEYQFKFTTMSRAISCSLLNISMNELYARCTAFLCYFLCYSKYVGLLTLKVLLILLQLTSFQPQYST